MRTCIVTGSIALALLSCGCRSHGPTTTAIAADPAPDSPIDARPPSDVPKPTEQLVLQDGEVIDLAAATVARKLEADVPQREASDGDSAYLVTKSGDLRAYSMSSGALRFTVAAPPCTMLEAGRGGAFCGKGGAVTSTMRRPASRAPSLPGARSTCSSCDTCPVTSWSCTPIARSSPTTIKRAR